MILQEVFRRLALTKLSNLADSVGNDIDETDKEKVLVHINSALLQLFTDFVLLKKHVIVAPQEGMTEYTLSSEFAVSSEDVSAEGPFYIMDTEDQPFRNDVIQILAVVDDEGHEHRIDNKTEWSSIYRSAHNKVIIPYDVREDGLVALSYQARFPELTLDKLNQEIPIPDALEEALLSYVAYNVYKDMVTAESTGAAMGHLADYERLTEKAEVKNLAGESLSDSGNKFSKNGWV